MTNHSDRIEALLSQATDAGKVPGVAVAAVLPDGEIVSAAAGLRDTTSMAPMRTDTIVWIASMTKAITSAAAMLLVEQGKL
jgi:methyl acetate hydrolase